jgi:phosphoribosylanthranilate isomerase
MTKIKICGLFREEDIQAVNEAGPDYIGFILNFPKSHRNVTAEEAAKLRRKLESSIRAVGVFVDQPSGTVAKIAGQVGLDVIQLHGHEDSDYIKDLKKRTGLPVWKAFRVRSPEDLVRAESSPADEILLDNGYGSGEVFDWTLTESLSRSFILAGGLNPENIEQAIRQMAPSVVDISSGVETNKQKDPQKIKAAVKAAHAKRNTDE